MGKPLRDLTGQVFGRLTVVSCSIKNYRGKACWLCECICGEKVTVIGNNLARGTSTSCGCFNKEIVHRKGKNLKTDSGMKLLYNMYKKNARGRKLDFELDVSLFSELTSSRCSYCGIAPYKIVRSERAKVPYTYNGIDRLDNEIGYVPGNCTSCCSTCNYAKRTMSYDAFMDWLSRVAHFNAVKFSLQPK